ncbi:DUF3427 domain-containing protein [Desulfotalea psychrophila]|nr:DEAD/DEAH box helicase [Desulfotalea psychrophila]
MSEQLPAGIYERVLDTELQELLQNHPELKVILRKIDDELAPHVYSQFVGKLIQETLHSAKKEQRIDIFNRILDVLSATDGLAYQQRHKLLGAESNLLLQVSKDSQAYVRPKTPMTTSSLLTGLGIDPPLEHELRAEMFTADRVDILISFIKWSGLRLLRPALEALAERNVPVRILSTSYMGVSDPAALEWLDRQPNIEVRVSYDSGGTRLHAKAYHFMRESGCSTAYIGSANMSHSAMTNGLEWTVKVTAHDMPHILSRFIADFASYWQSPEFEVFDKDRFQSVIQRFKQGVENSTPFFAEITPRPFQLRILESLTAARQNNSFRNLIVAATGTGKTVISALDYQRYIAGRGKQEPLLFVAHRKEILEQAMGCFRTVLRDQNFGELLVDHRVPTEWNHVFASIQSLNSKRPWRDFSREHFRFVIIDEAHHGRAASYRCLFDETCIDPEILLGLTATPERMDGSQIVADFDNRFAAEIRLPEALEEKLLCPFHYFGVSDSIDLASDTFWRNGRYDSKELEKVLTGDDIRARQRLDVVLQALERYQPNLAEVKAIGFCAGVKHAQYMADNFNKAGIVSKTLLGETPREERAESLRAFRAGKIHFLFTVDVLSEGVDIPEINLVLFLRPTESVTVFLQQLGRGLRHAPNKDCLTVLDFVGQTHRKYRLDNKFAALLSRRRQRIDREVEDDFPSLPPGCSIILERIARERIIAKIKSVLGSLNNFVPEVLRTWEQDHGSPVTFAAFIEETGLSPVQILRKKTWSEWKALANNQPQPADPDLQKARKALPRIALRTDPQLLEDLSSSSLDLSLEDPEERYGVEQATAMHYLFWGEKAEKIGVVGVQESFLKWRRNSSVLADVAEIAEWRRQGPAFPVRKIALPFPCNLQLHACYGSAEIKAALGLATVDRPGPAGQGVIHAKELKAYVHLLTFRKVERDFSPTTLYRDYPISPAQLHWESQSTIRQESGTGQNYIHFQERGYTILFFARLEKCIDGETAPFIYLGPAKELLSCQDNRPMKMVWQLEYDMPAALFEDARNV